NAHYMYVADDAVFPYGYLSEEAVIARVQDVLASCQERFTPDLVVIACYTASTLVLPSLRARWPHIPFVGTVPASKPAAETSQTRVFSVLATPGTVARDYTRRLIDEFAGDCAVTLVGSAQLARLAEGYIRGHVPDPRAVYAEISPCFVGSTDKRTDV